MNKYENLSEFRKNLNVLIEGVYISIKESLEYPSNTFALVFVMALSFLTFSLVFLSLNNLIENVANWVYIDYLMFLLLNLFCNRFFYMFEARYLYRYLLRGDLNITLCRPRNVFIVQSIKNMNGQDIITLLFIVIPLLIILFTNYTITLLFFLLVIFMCFYELILAQFIGSFSFYSKMLPQNMHLIDKQLYAVNRAFTPKMFEYSWLKNFIYVIPSGLMGFGIVEYLLGRYYILEYFMYGFFVCIVLILITILNWKYGLKKYEAFG